MIIIDKDDGDETKLIGLKFLSVICRTLHRDRLKYRHVRKA